MKCVRCTSTASNDDRSPENYSRQNASGRRTASSVEVFCYSQHLRGLIRTRVRNWFLSALNYVSPAPVRKPGLQGTARFWSNLGLVLRTPE